jgi:hypothetical protein
MAERDPSDVPPVEGGPPAIFPSQKQVLAILANMQKEIANIKKYVSRQPPEKILKVKAKKK